MPSPWIIVNKAHPEARSIMDGTGIHSQHGPHYSRKTPGSTLITPPGKSLVMITKDGLALWAVVLHRPAKGEGYVWRNTVFRNLGPQLSSDLIKRATDTTYRVWEEKYGCIPEERLRTEINSRRIKSWNPGCCYKKAGWKTVRRVQWLVYLEAPAPKTCSTITLPLYLLNGQTRP